jgi:hypothetical protein
MRLRFVELRLRIADEVGIASSGKLHVILEALLPGVFGNIFGSEETF